MDKLFYLIIEGIKNTWRHKTSALTAIFSLFILLYIIGLVSIFEQNAFKVMQTSYKCLEKYLTHLNVNAC